MLLLILACTAPDLADSGLDSDPLVEETGDSAPVEPVDADGDGFDADEDCDDDHPGIHPGADELCNMKDDDCDGEIDEDAVDVVTGWLDADGDGYGAGELLDGCALDVVDNDQDCDDASAEVHPDADEVCDGIDNDCDGAGDPNAVPGDFDTLQDAVDGLADGSEICVQAGTWTESVDVAERTLTFRGVDRETTVFELGDTPRFQADVDSEGGAGEWGDLTLIGLTVSGSWAVDDDVHGGLVWAENAGVTLQDIAVSGLEVTLSDGDLHGALVGVESGTLALEGLAVTDVTFDLVSDENDIAGGLVWADGSDVVVEDIAIQGLDATCSTTTGCDTNGLALYVEDGTLEAEGVWISDSHIAYDGGYYATVDGAFVFLEDVEGVVSDLSLDASSVTLDASFAYGVGLIETEDCELDWWDIAITDNEVSTDGGSGSDWFGLVRMDEGVYTLSGATVHGNSVTVVTNSAVGRAYGGLYASGELDFELLDVRDNHVSADEDAYGAGLVLFADDTAVVTNFILAGNTVESDGEIAAGAGLHTAFGSGEILLVNGDIVGNSATGSALEVGGAGVHGRYIARATIGQVDAINVNVVDNDVWMEDGVDLGDWAYTNSSDGAGAFDPSDWLADVDGNIEAEPGYTSLSGDPIDWDLTLTAGSACIDAGDGSILDADGSTSDIGAYGGPGGSW